jgi:NitT/TauT family transport system permease protein
MDGGPRRDRLARLLPGLVIPVLLIAWWTIATSGGRGGMFPSPGGVVAVLLHPFTDQMSSGSIAWSVFVSIVRISLGFSLAVLTGVPLGLLMGSSDLSRRLLSLATEMARPLSAIALLPLSIMIFRSRTLTDLLGPSSLKYHRHIMNELQLGMIFILTWGGFFPILLGTIQGVRGVRKLYIEAARVLGAGKVFVFRHILLPGALPDVFTGLRLAISRCWMVIIAAEMLPGTNSGMGYLIRYSYQLSRYDVMLACLVIVAVIGAILSKGLEAIGEKSLILRSTER